MKAGYQDGLAGTVKSELRKCVSQHSPIRSATVTQLTRRRRCEKIAR